MNSNFLIDSIGWIGAISLLAAYALVSMRKLEGDSLVYQLLNMMGGAFLIVNSFHYKAFPSVAVNVVWIGIAIYTMTRRKLVKWEKRNESTAKASH
jgi:uncharacterized membrane protein